MSDVPVPKKRYRPPKADKDTFTSQEKFLESLKPVSIATISENNRKCGHCWKRYGESDPGQNNPEEPVQFTCGHSFGEKCMKDLFGLPKTIQFHLRPFDREFHDGSNETALVKGLAKYIKRYTDEHTKRHMRDTSSDESNDSSQANDGSNDENSPPPRHRFHYTADPNDLPKVFSQLVEDILQGHGLGFLPTEWSTPIHNMMLTSNKLVKWEFLGNGVIYDIELQEPCHHHAYYMPNHPPAFTAPIDTPMLAFVANSSSTHTPPTPAPVIGVPSATSAPTTSAPTPSVTTPSASPTPDSTSSPPPLSPQAGPFSVYNGPIPPQFLPPGVPLPQPTAEQQAEHAQKYKEYQAKMAARQAELKKRRTENIAALGHELAAIHNLWLTRSTSSQSTATVNANSPLSSPSMSDHPVEFIDAKLVVHHKELSATDFEISTPRTEGIFIVDDSEDEAEDDSDSIPPESFKILMLERRICEKCVNDTEKRGKLVKSLPFVQSLSWQDGKKVPDSCPICARILFLKKQ